MKNFKLFIFLAIITTFCFVFSSYAQNTEKFCEKPLGFDFYTPRKDMEKKMSVKYGKSVSTKKGSTSWSNDRGNLVHSCFFHEEKLVGLSIINVVPENINNIDIIKDIFNDMLKLLNENKEWVFEKDIHDEIKTASLDNIDTKILGKLFHCVANPREKILISVARNSSRKLISIDLTHYLYGVGMKEYD
jgi:hypothetical protein